MDSRAVVLAKALGKSYLVGQPNELEVLRDVELQVMPGEFLAVIGQSGSGKSTLLNLLGALDTPTRGQLWIAQQEISLMNSDQLADLRSATIGFVFQFHYLLDEFTCLENALMPLLVRGPILAADKQRVEALMERVGLKDQMGKLPTQISGGQQQRTAIVRALANQPKLVLADEPTGNLDSRSGQQVFELMKEITRAQQVAFVMVTHDERLAKEADRVIRIEDGQVSYADV